MHCAIGKVSFSNEQLLENLGALIDEIVKAKPSGAKGQYIRGASLASTTRAVIPLLGGGQVATEEPPPETKEPRQ